MTPEQMVLLAEPFATLDFSEFRRKEGKPCYFIRRGLQGAYMMEGFTATPEEAWMKALQQLKSPSPKLPRAKPDPCWKFWQESRRALDNIEGSMQKLAAIISSEGSIKIAPMMIHEIKSNVARFQEQFSLLAREQKKRNTR